MRSQVFKTLKNLSKTGFVKETQLSTIAIRHKTYNVSCSNGASFVDRVAAVANHSTKFERLDGLGVLSDSFEYRDWKPKLHDNMMLYEWCILNGVAKYRQGIGTVAWSKPCGSKYQTVLHSSCNIYVSFILPNESIRDAYDF